MVKENSYPMLHSLYMLLFVFAALSALFSTGFVLLARVLSVKSDSPTAFSVVFGVYSALLSLMLFIIQPFFINPVSVLIIVLTILSTIFYGIYDRTQFYARKHVEASLVTIMAQLTPVATFLVSLVFFGESITLFKVLAFLLIISGNFLVVYKNGGMKLHKGMILAIVSAVAVGVAFAIDKKASTGFSLPLYASLVYLMPAVYNLLLPPLSPKVIINEVKVANWKLALLAASNVAAYFCLLKAFQLGEATTVIPIFASSTVLTVLASIFFLKEQSDVPKKLIAAGLVFAGIILINF